MSPSMAMGWGPQFRGADQDTQSSRTTHSTHPWIQHELSLGEVTSGLLIFVGLFWCVVFVYFGVWFCLLFFFFSYRLFMNTEYIRKIYIF